MKATLRLLLMCILGLYYAQGIAQERTVQNRPYTDLRTFHFGVLIGTHLQDIELLNSGITTIDVEDGRGPIERTVSVDQDRWDAGFTVGVLGELRLNQTFQFRVAPSMYFGTRHFTFRNITDTDATGGPTIQTQDMKTAYVSCALDLIAAGPRFNNHRPYLVAGINPMINLSGKDNDYIKLKRSDLFLELGVGCDFYLPFFKLRPELKFMYSIGNSLDKNHANQVRDKNMLVYSQSVSEANSKIIALTFYFE